MKTLYATLLSTVGALALLFLMKPSAPLVNSINFIPLSDGPAHPGWFAQWYEMRKNEAGIVPDDYLDAARAREAAFKTTAGALNAIAELGPDNVGGRTRAMIIDQNNHDHILAGGISGGLWHSTDRGITWSVVNDQAQSLAVTSLDQDPNQPNDIYFTTGEVRGNSAGISGDGVYKSTDGGQTFSQLPATAGNTDFDRTWRVQCAPTQPGVLYVATRAGGLYRSADAGNSFQKVFGLFGIAEVSDVEVFPDSSVLIGVRNDGIYYSPNGDALSFAKVTNGLPFSGFRRVELAYCDSMPNVVYAVYEESTGSDVLGAWKSTDQGQSWAPTGANPENTIDYRFPWYCLLLSVKPDNPNYVISGGAQLGHTTDGGQTWNYSANSHADYHSAVYDLDNPGIVYIGNDGGIYRYSSLLMTGSPANRNAGYNITQFYTGAYFPVSDIIGGTQDNGTWLSRSGATSFQKISGGDGAFCAVNQQNPNYSYVSYQRGYIRRSSNSMSSVPNYTAILNQLDGDNDGGIDDGAYFINPFVINLAAGNQLYYTTSERIWRTTNNGDDWTPLTTDISSMGSPYICGVSQDANPTVYIGGANALFYRMDSAATAAPGDEIDLRNSVPASIANHFISAIQVYPEDPASLYVTFSSTSSQPRIWRVTNATSASPVWTSVSGDMPAKLPVNWIAMHPQKPDSFLIAATDFGLYSSANGGANWTRETDVPNVPVFQVMIRPSDLKVYAFTHGRGVWTAEVPVFVNIDKPQSAEVSLYPVPARDFLRVREGQELVAGTAWTIVDVNGKNMLAGTLGANEIDVSRLSAGAYFLQFDTEDGLLIKKFLKN